MNRLKKFFYNKNVQWILSTIFFLLAMFIFTFVLCNIYKENKKRLDPKTDETTSIIISGTTVTNEAGDTIATIIDEETGEEITVVIDSDTGEVVATTTDPNTGEVVTRVITTKPTTIKTEPTTKLKMNVDKNVNNLTELKQSNLSAGKTIHTNGYYNANDGGEGYYRIEAKSNQTIDNGRYVLLDNGLVASLIAIDNTYNAKQFGAKGDNSTDDTTAITNAINCMNEANVYIPSGTYMISSRVSIPSNPKGILKGDGKSSLLKATAGTKPGSDILRIGNGNNITLRGIAISGNSEVNTKAEGHNDIDGIHLLDVWGSNNLTVENCYFIDNIYVGMRFMTGTTNLKVINNTFTNIDCGLGFMGAGNADNIIVEGNYFEGHQNSEPVTFYGTGRYTNITITKNTMKNKTYGNAILLTGFPNKECYFEKVYVTYNTISGTATGVILKYGHDVHIMNNNISDTQGGAGIKVTKSDNIEVKNNSVTRSKQWGIQVTDSSNVTVESNTLTNCGTANDNFFFADIRGENQNVLFNKNILNRTDDSFVNILMSVHSKGGVKITNNTFTNGKVWLGSDSEGIILTNNNVTVKDDGTNNIIN